MRSVNREGKLSGDPYFWAAILIPPFLAFLAAWPLWSGPFGWDTRCASLECYRTFAEAFKVPATIWALSIPLGALAVSAHRSRQTARQIQLQIEQNIFSNYYKHLEEFEKHAYSEAGDDEGKRKTIKELVHVRELHRLIYPNAQHENPQVSKSFERNVEEIDTLLKDALRESSSAMTNTRAECGGDVDWISVLVAGGPDAVRKLDKAMESIIEVSNRGGLNRSETIGAVVQDASRKVKNIWRIVGFDTSERAKHCSECLGGSHESLKQIGFLFSPIAAKSYQSIAKRCGVADTG